MSDSVDLLDCGIMNSLMEDPVILVENGTVYDRKHLCKWLLENPTKDPIGKEYDQPLSYCDAVPIRKCLMEKHGDDAYIRFDDALFKRKYLRAWQKQDLHKQSIDDDSIFQQGRAKRVRLPRPRSKPLSRSKAKELKGQGYTDGLIKAIARNNNQFPLRIWIIDNRQVILQH
jgi:hypothetical protein